MDGLHKKLIRFAIKLVGRVDEMTQKWFHCRTGRVALAMALGQTQAEQTCAEREPQNYIIVSNYKSRPKNIKNQIF